MAVDAGAVQSELFGRLSLELSSQYSLTLRRFFSAKITKRELDSSVASTIGVQNRCVHPPLSHSLRYSHAHSVAAQQTGAGDSCDGGDPRGAGRRRAAHRKRRKPCNISPAAPGGVDVIAPAQARAARQPRRRRALFPQGRAPLCCCFCFCCAQQTPPRKRRIARNRCAAAASGSGQSAARGVGVGGRSACGGNVCCAGCGRTVAVAVSEEAADPRQQTPAGTAHGKGRKGRGGCGCVRCGAGVGAAAH